MTPNQINTIQLAVSNFVDDAHEANLLNQAYLDFVVSSLSAKQKLNIEQTLQRQGFSNTDLVNFVHANTDVHVTRQEILRSCSQYFDLISQD